MADGSHIEVAKAYVTIVPSLEGSQGEITKELTGVTNTAAASAGQESGSTFGSNLAAGIKATSAVIAAAVAAATAAAVAVGKEFIEAANDVAAYGDEVDKTSQKMGMSAQAYQEWDYVMKIAGTDMASMTTGMKTLTNKVADAASGSSEAAAMFSQLGISMEDLQTLSQEEIFGKTIEALQGMEEGTERAALANDLFGKSGMNLAPLLNMTADETQELIDKANEYGMIMGDDAVKASADYTDAVTTLKNTFKGLKNSLMGQFLPSLTTVMEGLSAVFAGDEGGIQMIKQGLEDLTANIATVTPQLFELVETIVTALLAGFGPMLPQVVASIFSFINQAIVTITTMIPQLTPAITEGVKGICAALLDALPLLISALIDMVEDLVVWLASDNNVKTLIDGILTLVSILATGLADALPILLPALVNIIGQIAASISDPANVQMILTAVLYIVGAIVVALVAALPQIGGVIVTYITNIVGNIKNFGTILMNWLTPFITNIKNTFTNWLTNLKNSFTSAFENIKTKVSQIIENIKGFVSTIIEKLQSLPSEVVNIGKDLIKGLWNGISDKVDWVCDKIKGMGTKVINAIKDIFGIASPSKVFAEIGDFMAQGLGLGFEDTMDTVEGDMLSSMSGLTGNMTAEVTATGTTGAIFGGGSTYNGGAITVNVYGAEGQDVNALADAVAYKLEEMTTRRSAVYG